MPSFLQTLKRMILGEPIFQVDQKPPGTGTTPPTPVATPNTPSQPVVSKGPKILPQVVLERIEYRMSGSDIEYSADIHNLSDQPIELDKVKLLNATRELDRPLGPGDKREFLIYRGAPARDNYNRDCELYYKDKTGDYFCASHDIEYAKQQDGTYLIQRFRLEPPIRDV